jgi:hypothetical protein
MSRRPQSRRGLDRYETQAFAAQPKIYMQAPADQPKQASWSMVYSMWSVAAGALLVGFCVLVTRLDLPPVLAFMVNVLVYGGMLFLALVGAAWVLLKLWHDHQDRTFDRQASLRIELEREKSNRVASLSQAAGNALTPENAIVLGAGLLGEYGHADQVPGMLSQARQQTTARREAEAQERRAIQQPPLLNPNMEIWRLDSTQLTPDQAGMTMPDLMQKKLLRPDQFHPFLPPMPTEGQRDVN